MWVESVVVVGGSALEERTVKWKLEACEPIGVCEEQGELELRLSHDENIT